MASTIALLMALAVGVLAIRLIWRGARRLTGMALLEEMTVSREWLMHHQTDDRS
jgi:hypothetical protein